MSRSAAGTEWRTVSKDPKVTGTWQTQAFQCSLRDVQSRTSPDVHRPIIPTSSSTGYHQITHCTVDTGNRSHPLFPELLVRLPVTSMLRSADLEIPGMPRSLRERLPSLQSLDAYVAVYSPDEQLLAKKIRFCFQFCQCIHKAETNSPVELSRTGYSVRVPVEVGAFAFEAPESGDSGEAPFMDNVVARTTAVVVSAEQSETSTSIPATRVRMKNVCSVDLTNPLLPMRKFCGVFSWCAVPNHLNDLNGPSACLMLHVFPLSQTISKMVSQAVHSHSTLGPLVQTLQQIATTSEIESGTRAQVSPHHSIFHHVAKTLDSLCATSPGSVRCDAPVQRQGMDVTPPISPQEAMALAVDSVEEFLPVSSVHDGADKKTSDKNHPVSGRNQDTTTVTRATNASDARESTRSNVESQKQRLWKRREKWLMERFMALHTRERLQRVQERERTVATSAAAAASSSEPPTGHQTSELLAQERALQAAAMQSFQVSLLSRVDDKFDEVQRKLAKQVEEQLQKALLEHQSKLEAENRNWEDRVCERLEKQAARFVSELAYETRMQFQTLQDSVLRSQAALQQLCAQGPPDTINESTGVLHTAATALAPSPNASFLLEDPDKFSPAVAAASIPTVASSPLPRNNENTTLGGGGGGGGDNSVDTLQADDKSENEQWLLLRAKEQELRHLESQLKLKENHLRSQEEELEERAEQLRGPEPAIANATPENNSNSKLAPDVLAAVGTKSENDVPQSGLLPLQQLGDEHDPVLEVAEDEDDDITPVKGGDDAVIVDTGDNWTVRKTHSKAELSSQAASEPVRDPFRCGGVLLACDLRRHLLYV